MKELEPKRKQFYTATEKEAQSLRALELKRLGWLDVDIAADLGVGLATVYRRLRRALDSHTSPEVEHYRMIGTQRYESYLRVFHAALERDPDNLDAASRAAVVNEKMMRLQGAELPQQVNVEVHQVTEQEKQLREMLAQAERDQAVREATITGEVVEDERAEA